jgi:hypothetical protein
MSFCSSAFPERILLNRKILSENFRLKMQISRRRPAFKNPALGRDFQNTLFLASKRARPPGGG